MVSLTFEIVTLQEKWWKSRPLKVSWKWTAFIFSTQVKQNAYVRNAEKMAYILDFEIWHRWYAIVYSPFKGYILV